MDICLITLITLITVIVFFIVSTVTDIILFRKLFRTKKVVVENNREIYDHDKTLADLQEKVKTLQNG